MTDFPFKENVLLNFKYKVVATTRATRSIPINYAKNRWCSAPASILISDTGNHQNRSIAPISQRTYLKLNVLNWDARVYGGARRVRDLAAFSIPSTILLSSDKFDDSSSSFLSTISFVCVFFFCIFIDFIFLKIHGELRLL